MSKNKDSKSKDQKVHSPEVHVAAPGHEDDFVIVPKQRSRASYLFMLGLMLFVLLIFTVGGLFTSVVGGGGGGPVDEVVMRWTAPGGAQQEVKASELNSAMRTVDTLANLRFYRPINRAGEARPNIEEEDAVLILILDRLAQENGVEVSDSEFSKRLVAGGWTGDQMRSVAEQYRTTTRELEKDIRIGLRVNKFRSMVEGMAVMAADPAAVESSWQEANPEFQFQVVEIQTADYKEQAAANVLDDAALTDWYHALPGWKQQKLFTEDKMLPHVAYVDSSVEFDSSNLLGRYPLPEDWDADTQAESFYNRYTTTRYKRPEPAEGEEPNADLYLSFEDVKERATEDSQVFYALGLLLADLKERTTKAREDTTFASPEFQMESESLGLTFDAPFDILTRTEVQERAGWGSIETSNQFGFLQVDSYCASPIVNETSMVLGYLHKKIRPQEPEFSVIRDDVVDLWAEEHAGVIAKETLQGIFDSFAPKDANETTDTTEEAQLANEPIAVDGAAFAAAVEAAGLTIIERPFLGRNKAVNDDREQQSEVGRHLRSQRNLYSMDAGMLAAPATGITGTSTCLVRLADKRDPELSGLKAQDIYQLRRNLVNEQFRDFQKEAFDPESESFKTTFALWLLSWDRDAERAAEEAGDTEIETPTGDA
jgi:hypothetical protein